MADEIAGKVESVDAAAKSLTISGITVTGADARIYKPVNLTLAFSDLKVGETVKVKGDFSGPLQMNARKIEIVAKAHGRVRGLIEKTDPATRTVTIGGITVSIPQGAKVGGDDDEHRSSFDLFVPGMEIECKGTWTGKAGFSAREVDIKD